MQMGARPPSKIATQHGTRVPLPRSKHRISPVLHKRCPLVEYLLLARRKKLAQLGPCDPRAAAALPTHAHQAVAPQRVRLARRRVSRKPPTSPGMQPASACGVAMTATVSTIAVVLEASADSQSVSYARHPISASPDRLSTAAESAIGRTLAVAPPKTRSIIFPWRAGVPVPAPPLASARSMITARRRAEVHRVRVLSAMSLVTSKSWAPTVI